MPDIPPEAVAAAVAAIEREVMLGTLYADAAVESDDYYRLVLEAAAPHIRAQVYAEIRQLAITEADRLRGGNFGPRTADVKALSDFADLIPGGETGG